MVVSHHGRDVLRGYFTATSSSAAWQKMPVPADRLNLGQCRRGAHPAQRADETRIRRPVPELHALVEELAAQLAVP